MKFTLKDYQADGVDDVLRSLDRAKQLYDVEGKEVSVSLTATTGAGVGTGAIGGGSPLPQAASASNNTANRPGAARGPAPLRVPRPACENNAVNADRHRPGTDNWHRSPP